LHFLTGRGGLLRLCGGDGKGGNSGSGSEKFQVHTFSSMLLLERQRLMSSAVVPRKFLGHCMMMLRHDRESILPHSSVGFTFQTATPNYSRATARVERLVLTPRDEGRGAPQGAAW
jgi:hypothetical protein